MGATRCARTDVGGAYRWDEATGTWFQLMRRQAFPGGLSIPGSAEVDGLALAPSNSSVLYAAIGDTLSAANGRVLRSDSTGDAWTSPGTARFRIAGNAEHRYGRNVLAVDPTNPDSVWLGTRLDGLQVSTDGAKTWTQLTSLPAATGTESPGVGISLVVLDPTSPIVNGMRQGAVVGVSGRGLLRTTDGGKTFTLLYGHTTGWARSVARDSNGALLVALHGHGGPSRLIRCPAGGGAPVDITPRDAGGNPRSNISAVAVHPTNPSLILRADEGVRDGHLHRSADGGATWTDLNIAITNGKDGTRWATQSELEGYMTTGDLDWLPDGRVQFVEGMGVWTSSDLTDSEVTFDFDSAGIQEIVANASVKPKGSGAVLGGWDRNVWKVAADGQVNLPLSGKFSSCWDVQAQPGTDGRVLVATVNTHQGAGTDPDARLSAVSTDAGTSWARLAGLVNGTLEAGLRFGTKAISRSSIDRQVWAPGRRDDPANDITGVPLRYTTDRWATSKVPTVPGFLATGETIAGYEFLKQRHLVSSPWEDDTFYAISYTSSTSSAPGNTYLLKSTGMATWTRTRILDVGGYQGEYHSRLVAVEAVDGLLLLSPGPRDGDAQQPAQRSLDRGGTWATMPILGAHEIGVGAPLPGKTNPTFACWGQVGGVWGFYSSTDLGVSWQPTGVEPALSWDQMISCCAGDSEVPGRFVIGLTGGSWFEVDIPLAA